MSFGDIKSYVTAHTTHTSRRRGVCIQNKHLAFEVYLREIQILNYYKKFILLFSVVKIERLLEKVQKKVLRSQLARRTKICALRRDTKCVYARSMLAILTSRSRKSPGSTR